VTGRHPPTPPIVVDNTRDGVSFYASVQVMERELEPWYPRDEQFVAYDAEGRLVEMIVEQRERTGRFGRRLRHEVVTASATEMAPTHADELRASLIAQLGRQNGDIDMADTAPLHEVLRRTMEGGEVLE
jgi:hypothetical protein